MRDNNDQLDFTELFLLALQGEITPEQMKQFDLMLKTDPAKIRDYAELMEIYTELSSAGSIEVFNKTSDSREKHDTLLQLLASEENRSPAIDIPVPEKPKEVIQKVQKEKIRYSINRNSLATLCATAAAILLLLVFVYFVPRTDYEVAVLSDSINAKWGHVDGEMERGVSIFNGRKDIELLEGCAQFQFDNHTLVTIEGPASFHIPGRDQVTLRYGKLYAVVPHQAIGFSVHTENAKIIDLGTEFGVQADIHGGTSVYVMQGKTKLVAGKKSLQEGVEVGRGIAKRISSGTSEISDIAFNDTIFIRNIDSENQIIWNGRLNLDLADMVQKGNGLGTGSSEERLNYEKGFTTEIRWGHTSIFETYLPIEDAPFIDGIFIPNGSTIISSRGDVFEGFPFTNGVYCADLIANPKPGAFVIDGQPRTIQFGGQEYSDLGKSCIVMQNSNHGITFDLDAIRSCYNIKIERFESEVGLVDFDGKRCNANFYVLVDGQLRYSLPGYNQKGILNRVLVNLRDTDRFLTLATSENVDQADYMANSTLHENWCVFAEPVLVLESGDQGI